ncbi:PH domain-containing protein [Serinibacter salmoneus]|uniref:Putative membrane protein n=1 Tax=Serinibacter salmoneus TaxID=556530 RepID=A0A2A9CW32_9MICO|nr:PH domain-containing protein [Serinibacter salmoneus]PFG18637.1 putative membrane protein [Serinibacter salmoneus]
MNDGADRPSQHEGPWLRLSGRVVWVDLAKSVMSVLPGVVAIALFDVEPTDSSLWPFVAIAMWGIISAGADLVRWAATRYRVTPDAVERRTGVLVRRERMIYRDRIRSVDLTAHLRHRLSGLRVVTVGAGQQAGAGESALHLDALSVADALNLQERLLIGSGKPPGVPVSSAEPVDPASAAVPEGRPDGDREQVQVLARFRAGWVAYNVVGVWGYVTAAGVLWGAYWALGTVGVDLVQVGHSVSGWDDLRAWHRVLIVVGLGAVVGGLGMAVNFIVGYWGFELARTRSGAGTYLRTRRGLLSRREVNRDEARVRGISIGQPLLWRWMRMADTNVITTGLSVWSVQQPSAIVPRGPLGVAREVAREVLAPADPFAAPLVRHPGAALRRRAWWATWCVAAVVLFFAPSLVVGLVPLTVLWFAPPLLILALLLAWASFRALGHGVDREYAIVRSGTMSRTTSALRRDAVSTVAVRQSILQRRLGLSTVTLMTAAGWWAYPAPDLSARDAVEFASDASAGLLDAYRGDAR